MNTGIDGAQVANFAVQLGTLALIALNAWLTKKNGRKTDLANTKADEAKEQATETHALINSRMDELLASKEQVAFTAGGDAARVEPTDTKPT